MMRIALTRAFIFRPAGPIRSWNIIIIFAIPIAIGFRAADPCAFLAPLIEAIASNRSDCASSNCTDDGTFASITIADIIAKHGTSQSANCRPCPSIALDIACCGTSAKKKGDGQKLGC
jgi:hypothetical protein